MSTRARSYYHRNRKDILVFLLSALIGLSIVGINVWNYNQTTQRYQISLDTADAEILAVREAKDMEIVFPLQEPGTISGAEIEILFRDVHPRTQFDITLNGQLLEEDLDQLIPGSSITLNPSPSALQRRNVLTIHGTFELATQAQIQSINITGFGAVRRMLFLVFNLLGLIITIGPILSLKYIEYQTKAELEDRFPDFLRDIVEGTRSGMSLPQSIKNTTDNDYGRLTKYVEEMSAKLDWGISFETILTDFAEKSGSTIIRRSVTTIIQTYNSGGNISTVLNTVGTNLKEIKKLRRERESELYGELVTGYIVYFVFLVVLIGMVRYLIPTLGFSINLGPLTGGAASTQSAESLVNQFRPLFRNLIIIQSIFSGLVIGKLSEGQLKAGAKHVAVLLTVGYLAAIFFM